MICGATSMARILIIDDDNRFVKRWPNQSGISAATWWKPAARRKRSS
jgi:hypothetical protein